MRCLVTGAYGLLGAPLSTYLQAAGHDVFRQGRCADAEVRCDLGDTPAFTKLVAELAPDVIINLVAATDVDACEAVPAKAFDANVRMTEAIVRGVAGMSGVHLVHLSTDQVYDGPGPHCEERTAPGNVYGITKYAGELVAAAAGATILRTNFVGRSGVAGRTSLSDWIVGALRERRRLTLFEDVFFSPLHVSSLCRFIELAADRKVAGIFNLGARGGVSKADFGLQLAALLGLDVTMVGVGSVTDAALKAKRPLDMTMVVDRFAAAFGCSLPTVADEICLAAKDYGA